MQIRAMTTSDLSALGEIDATIESLDYLHVERAGGGGISLSLRVEQRPLRTKQITSNPIDDELRITYRQLAGGADEGIALVAEHDGQVVAAAAAQPDVAHGTLRLIDIRVDYDFRRQGIGSAMGYQIIQSAREAGQRAVAAETRSGNFPANRFLAKLGFQLAGVDVQRHSNHDLVSEAATLFWYAELI
jgi:ribosomal protein S18 acetylase RimI-like enzyme